MREVSFESRRRLLDVPGVGPDVVRTRPDDLPPAPGPRADGAAGLGAATVIGSRHCVVLADDDRHRSGSRSLERGSALSLDGPEVRLCPLSASPERAGDRMDLPALGDPGVPAGNVCPGPLGSSPGWAP